MRRTLTIVSLLACLARPGVAPAQEVDGGVEPDHGAEPDGGVEPQEWGHERVLGGHIFQYPTLTNSAFLASTLNFQVLATFNASRTTNAEDTGSTTVQQVAPLLNIDLVLHVADPVAISFGLTGAAASGASTSSLILKGESLSYALKAGVIIKLLRDERSATQIALHAGGLFASGTTINLRALVEIVQDNSGITIGDIVNSSLGEALLTPFDTYQGNVGGALAHAFARWLSLQTSLTFALTGVSSSPYDVSTQTRQSESQVVLTPSAAVAMTFDASSFHVPLALMAEYRLGISWASADSTTTTTFSNGFDLGMFYSGRSDLQAGLVFVAFIGVPPLGVLGPSNTGSTVNGYGTIITVRYVW